MDIAVLGAGGMGETVIGHLVKANHAGRIIPCDIRPQRIAQLNEKYNLHGTTDLARVLEDDAVKLVFVTASNMAHAELSIAALEAGKAVMCEKPMAATLPDAQRMVDTAQRVDGYLQIGFELRYSRLYATVKQWIDQGLLGDVVHSHCIYINEESYGRQSWRIKKASGGMFGEKLSHYVDLPRWWIGSPVTEVYSACSPNVVPHYEIRDNYQTTCKHANGAVSHLSFMMPVAETFSGDPLQDIIDQQRDSGHELRYIVMGTKGAAETDVFRRKIKRYAFTDSPTRLRCTIEESLTWPSSEDHVYYHNTQDQTLDIIRRVREGLPPYTPAWDSLETMKVCAAAELSADTGKPVSPADTLSLAASQA